jgi:hypothetical protein
MNLERSVPIYQFRIHGNSLFDFASPFVLETSLLLAFF